MTVEINRKFVKDDAPISLPGGPTIMITPPLDEDYWLYRVPLKHGQAMVAFPKFGIIGCGFAKEEDWNTNLPLQLPAEKIYAHIQRNKGHADITDTECIEAIRSLQRFVAAQEEKAE